MQHIYRKENESKEKAKKSNKKVKPERKDTQQ